MERRLAHIRVEDARCVEIDAEARRGAARIPLPRGAVRDERFVRSLVRYWTGIARTFSLGRTRMGPSGRIVCLEHLANSVQLRVSFPQIRNTSRLSAQFAITSREKGSGSVALLTINTIDTVGALHNRS